MASRSHPSPTSTPPSTPIHNQIKEGSRERFAAEPTERLVGALGGRMLTLDSFCRTRMIEVLLHLDEAPKVRGTALVSCPGVS
ncbi:MAG: hypothetical protein GY929_17185 [Actinomycetia bacterium]|nr:hypothetical protein [Actinomycetes bacterium]